MPELRAMVFVVDDDVSVREALDGLVRSAGLKAVACKTAREFLRRPRPPVPSCLVLDVCLPGLDGFGLQRHLAGSRRELPIIFITGHADIPTTVRAMKAGAVDFLSKPFTDEVLLASIRQALIKDHIARRERSRRQAVHERYASLTAREKEVMAMVVAGHPNKRIAAELGVTEITVKVHRGQGMQKMRAASLPDLVRMEEMLRAEI